MNQRLNREESLDSPNRIGREKYLKVDLARKMDITATDDSSNADNLYTDSNGCEARNLKEVMKPSFSIHFTKSLEVDSHPLNISHGRT